MDAAEQGRRLLDAARRQRKLLKAEPGSCVDRIFREMDSLLESAIGKPEAAPVSNQDAAAIAQHAVDEINQRTKELGRSPILTDAADDESDAPTVFPPREEMKERIDAMGKKLRGIGDAARKGAEALLAERGEESAAKS